MHREPKQFIASVKRQYPEYFTGKKVLEVGSLDINGSVRPFFTGCRYTGIDLGDGPGVDQIDHVTNLTAFDAWFDVIISTETLEHDAKWNESLKAMYRLLKPSGLLVITCAAPNRPEHGTTRTGSAEASPFTSDYYRNISVEDFASILRANLFSRSYLGYRGHMDDLYFAGIKSGDSYEDPLLQNHDLAQVVQSRKLTITAEISSKDRYHFLPLTISAILNQTHKPNKLVIYDDGEQKDLRKLSPFDGLLRLADHLGIAWTVFTTPREGQVRNHQHALDNAATTHIWRVDDDQIPEPNCLENLLVEMKNGVGAVAGLVHHPCGVPPLVLDTADGSLIDFERPQGVFTDGAATNIQWCSWNGDQSPRKVEHLYSTFLYSVEAARKAGGYPRDLSVIGHREESWFTIAIGRAGYELIVTPLSKTWHLRQDSGGIRSFSDTSLWEHDDLLFQEYLKTLRLADSNVDLKILDCGLGDTLLFRGLLVDEFKRKFPNRRWRLAVCYPQVFESIDNVELISIAEAKTLVGDRYQDYSLYEYGWHHGNGRHILEVMREFYGR